MGGVRQQFTTEAEVRLAQASVGSSASSARRSSSRSATSSSRPQRTGSPSWRAGARSRRPRRAGRERRRVRSSTGFAVDDVLGATICREDGIADPARCDARARAAAAALGVEVRERTDALSARRRHARGRLRCVLTEVARARGVELPVRPLVRQLADVGPVEDVPVRSADDDRGEHLSFPPRRSRRTATRDERAGSALGRAGGSA